MDPVANNVSAPASPSGVPARIPSAELIRLAEAFCSSTDLPSHYRRLGRLVHWMQRRGISNHNYEELLTLADYLRNNPEMRARFQANVGELLKNVRSISLLAESGIPSDVSLFSEILRRMVGRILPSARSNTDAAKFLTRLYSSNREARHFAEMPPEVFELMATVFTPQNDPEFWEQERQDLREAVRLLAVRAGSLGLKPEVRQRSSPDSVFHSPFYRLVSRTEELLRANGEDTRQRITDWQGDVERCREEMAAVHRHMENSGVSVGLVFDLKKIEACLTRMEALLMVQFAPNSGERVFAVHSLLDRLIAGRLSDDSLGAYLRDNLNLVARKTVERTGRSGEHYIAQTREEYRLMWLAALGGGLLTVFTAAVKLRILDSHLPPFVEAFVAGTNYAVSFILLQVFHLVLATKQPAATAATFAGIVRDSRGEERSSKFADFVARITRSQLAAALGNVIAVSLGAIVFEKLWSVFFRQSYLVNESAEHVYETLHPFVSLTWLYAIITGVILWLAALAGGWCENFAVFYRLPEAIAEHPLGLRVGVSRMRAIARAIDRNLGGWCTSIVLGYLLGFTPEIGQFFGLPLDVRHVTLSTGTLALAAAHFGTHSLSDNWFYHAVGGIGITFVLNLSVSFLIAAVVALRAYNVRLREQLEIFAYLCRAALRSPLRFILPVDDRQQPRPPRSGAEDASANHQNAAAD